MTLKYEEKKIQKAKKIINKKQIYISSEKIW